MITLHVRRLVADIPGRQGRQVYPKELARQAIGRSITAMSGQGIVVCDSVEDQEVLGDTYCRQGTSYAFLKEAYTMSGLDEWLLDERALAKDFTAGPNDPYIFFAPPGVSRIILTEQTVRLGEVPLEMAWGFGKDYMAEVVPDTDSNLLVRYIVHELGHALFDIDHHDGECVMAEDERFKYYLNFCADCLDRIMSKARTSPPA